MQRALEMQDRTSGQDNGVERKTADYPNLKADSHLDYSQVDVTCGRA